MRKPNCERCRKRICLKDKKPCRKVENWLAQEQSKEGYSERQVRRREIPYDPKHLDFLVEEAIKRLKGRRKNVLYTEED